MTNKKRSSKILKLRKEVHEAKKKIISLSNMITTLQKERAQLKSSGISKSMTDQTTVDWKWKLEMEKNVRLTKIKSWRGSNYQFKSVSPHSCRGINGNEMRTTNNRFQLTCVTDFQTKQGVSNVTQVIWPYENRLNVVGAPPLQAVPSMYHVEIYNSQLSVPTSFIPQAPVCAENVMTSCRKTLPYPSQDPFLQAKYTAAIPNCILYPCTQ